MIFDVKDLGNMVILRNHLQLLADGPGRANMKETKVREVVKKLDSFIIDTSVEMCDAGSFDKKEELPVKFMAPIFEEKTEEEEKPVPKKRGRPRKKATKKTAPSQTFKRVGADD
jgi:hypothetical protein